MITRICWIAVWIFPAALGYGQQPADQQPVPKKPASPKPEKKRTTAAPPADQFGTIRIAHDDTGYIESGFIQSQLRFRFDSAFDDRNIDLASYVYSGGLPSIISKLNGQEYHFYGEYAFARRLSAFLNVPIRSISPTVSYVCMMGMTACPEPPALQAVLQKAPNQRVTDLTDVRAGLKLGLISRPGQQLTFQLSTSFPTGTKHHGLGIDHNTIEPFVLYAQRLTPHLNVFGEIGDTHPIGGIQSCVLDPAPQKDCSMQSQNFAGDVVNYGVGTSYGLSHQSRVRFTPVLELVGWKVTGGLVTIVAPCRTVPAPNVCPTGQFAAYIVPPNNPLAYGSNIVNLKLGLRTSWGDHNSIYAGAGVQLSHAGWYRQVLRIEYRYIFKRPL